MNIFKLVNKESLIDKKASMFIEKLLKEKENIDSEITVYYKVWSFLRNLYNYMDTPSFKFIKADNSPISRDYKEMIDSAALDIRVLTEDSYLLENSMISSFDDMELTRTMLEGNIKYLDKMLKNIQSRNLYGGALSFEELFYKNNNESTSDTLANVNTKEGYLSLKIKRYTDINIYDLSIDEKSNGFPGSSHTADITDGEIRFLGEADAHKTLKEITDRNMDTWFEYEAFKVSDETLDITNGFGFRFKEGDSWLLKGDNLNLSLKLTINNRMNFLSLAPFVPEDKDALPPIISTIQFYYGNDVVKEYRVNQLFKEKTLFIFEEIQVDYIKVNFIQSKSYDTKIGHVYYVKTNSLKQSIFEESKDFERIEGKLPSKEILNPYVKDSKNYNDLFYPLNDSADIKGEMEILDASRYSIGIRSIQAADYEFYPVGEYISSSYTSKASIKSISIETNEYTPSEFDSFNQYIKYYISIDNGENWYPILPKHKSYLTNELDKEQFEGNNPYSIYLINNDDALELRNASVGYIDTVFEALSVKVKVSLSRPNEDKYKFMSPVIYSYKINIETEGDFDEY